MVNQLIQELEIVEGYEVEPKIGNQHQQKPRNQRWIPLEHGLCKINTDAAVDGARSKGAIAVVCRENNGEFVAASAMTVPNVTDPETLEAMACLEALALAEDCAIRKMIVASDCLNVVRNIKEMPRSFECAKFAHEAGRHVWFGSPPVFLDVNAIK
ncbi:hypothetical protein SETIT_3G305600v2 [Setaria italica]|uniref:RNase H type-1 domain-containing protein n=1 Tax=Setaria italica TaxID=4555 RepID=K3ZF68_SETIT|nr:hypothetical protein SETIT_3G305600v2 [Setaria italica]